MSLAICVFCSACNDLDEKYQNIARQMGRFIGTNNHSLVYGGSRSGLMGITADAALDAGANAYGVIPEFLKEKEIMHDGLTELHITDTMHERQLKMSELGDVFIILPGGMGTMAEFFEITTWKLLGLHSKPIIIVNTDGYWTDMVNMIQKMQDDGFLHNQSRHEIYEVVDDLEDIKNLIET